MDCRNKRSFPSSDENPSIEGSVVNSGVSGDHVAIGRNATSSNRNIRRRLNRVDDEIVMRPSAEPLFSSTITISMISRLISRGEVNPLLQGVSSGLNRLSPPVHVEMFLELDNGFLGFDLLNGNHENGDDIHNMGGNSMQLDPHLVFHSVLPSVYWNEDMPLTFTALLERIEQNGNMGRGLAEEVILGAMQPVPYQQVNVNVEDEKNDCCICLETYREGDEIGKLGCGHFHHFRCIKEWLQCKNVCPICRATGLTV